MTEIDTQQILVIDNYFPKYLQQSVHDDLLDMDWGFKNSPYADFNSSRMFGITLYHQTQHKKVMPNSIWNITQDIIDDILYDHSLTLYRILANMQGIYQYAEVHTDSSETNWLSLIYHVNDSEGDTCFYNEKTGDVIHSVSFKMGRMVIFPAHYWHQGMPPERYINPTNNFRMSLGYCFELN